MRTINKARLLLMAAAAVMLSIFLINCRSENYIHEVGAVEQEAESYIHSSNDMLQCLYYDETLFVNIKSFKELNETSEGRIRGCILPHHLTAVDLIHEVFQNVSSYEYDTVVIMGPDHESIERGKIFTAAGDWQTPFGILKTDYELTYYLLQNSFVLENNEKMTSEHSVSSIIPFIKYYMGDAKVVSLALTKQTRIADIETLIDDILKKTDAEKTLFIASVDFSHYLNLDEAERMDLISMEAIENMDVEKIMSFTNDNMDSPVSIVTMMKIMERLNTGTHVLNHSNSEIITKVKTEETTSYITYLFY